jgi:hypothetical protein
MRITVAVPTYKRPSELARFIHRNAGLLERLDVSMAIFHNEPNPDYSPQETRKIKAFFGRDNRGITGNQQLISSYFMDKSEYYILASDQDTINPNALSALIDLIIEIKPSCVGFARGSDNITCSTADHSLCTNYADWLGTVSVSELIFAYKGGLLNINPFLTKNLPGMAMWRSLPSHSLVLHSALTGHFLGASTGLRVYGEDPMGSVASGWTGWIPNIIICHLIFIRFTIYAFYSAMKEDKSCSKGRLESLIQGYSRGLLNHVMASIELKMYSGPRISSTIRRLIQLYPGAFAGATLESFENFFFFNSAPLLTLPDEWTVIYDQHRSSIDRFKSSYPDWGYL